MRQKDWLYTMLLTLPLILFIVLTELSIGAFTVLYLLDWRNQVKRSFLVTYAIIHVILSGVTVLFQQSFARPGLLNPFSLLDKDWTGCLPLTLLLFLLLMLPYTIFLWFDKRAGVDGKKKAEGEGAKRSLLRILRMICGGLAILAGLATLLVLGMIFRPLATSSIAGAITVGSFFASALALRGGMAPLWLGPRYLLPTPPSCEP